MADTAAVAGKDPVYKDGQATLSNSLTRLPQAAADLVGGLFVATGQGFSAFSNELNKQSLLGIGADNAVVSGSVAASREFFAHLAKVSDEVYSRLRTPGAAAQPIDYDMLAQKVAALIQKPAR